MPAVGDDRAVLETLDGAAIDDVDVAGDGDHDVGIRRCLGERHDPVAVHHRLERTGRIDLGHDHMRAEPGRTAGESAAAPAVAADDERLAGEQHVGGPDQTVDGALPGAVTVVEEMLGERLVDRDDRELERAVLRHRAEPDHAGGGLLGAGDHVVEQLAAALVQLGNEVGAVVHRDLRARVEHGLDMRVVPGRILALDGVCRDPVLARERRRDGSCVDSGLLAQRLTWAPPAFSVIARFAVSLVTWRHAPSRSPSSGRSRAKRSRMMRRTGISRAAQSMRRCPSPARLGSATSDSATFSTLVTRFLHLSSYATAPCTGARRARPIPRVRSTRSKRRSPR